MLGFKPMVVQVKLAELRAARNSPSFKNHLFELSVLGDLALKKALIDIEEASTAVDGVINIDGRDVLVEATNTTQRVIPDFALPFPCPLLTPKRGSARQTDASEECF